MTSFVLSRRIWPSVALCCAMGLGALPAFAQERPELRQVIRSCAGGAATYQAGARQTIEVVFPDGASIVLAPGSRGTVACDANGAIKVTLDAGLVRVSGGLTNRAQPVVITSAGTQTLLTNGSAIVASDGTQTRAHLLNGQRITVTRDGQERVLSPRLSGHDQRRIPQPPDADDG